MFKRKLWLGCMLIAFSTRFVCAQETWGISNSNFAGSMGVFLNPSSIAFAPYRSELNFIAADVFADNNYAYLKKRSNVIVKSITGESVGTDGHSDYYTVLPDKQAYLSSYVLGPSYISSKETYGWGVHIANRNTISASNVPFHLAKFIYEGFDYSPQHNINYTSGAFKSALLGWFELGGTYARVLLKSEFEKHVIKAGITVNLLAGNYGIFLNAANTDYVVPDAHLLVVNTINATYGHSSPNNGDNIVGDLLKIRGWGASTTIGFTYINSLNKLAYDCDENAESLKKYKYRLGLSFMDFGYIKFNSKATRTFELKNASTYWQGVDTTKFLSWFYLDTLLSNKFYGNPFQSRAENTFTVFLPTAISLQLDYAISPKYYVNATVVKNLPVSAISVIRSSQVSITPRYETRKFEIDVPLTVYEFSKPHLGFALRYGMLVIGTDRLGTFIGLWDATGFDFFFGIKINKCTDRYSSGKRNRNKNFCDT